MVCGTCHQPFGPWRRPNCVACAQAFLQNPRIKQAVALLEREKAHAHVEALFRPGNDGVLASLPEDADWDAITQGMKKSALQKTEDERKAVEARIELIVQKARDLQTQINDHKSNVQSRREEYLRRRVELEDRRRRLATEKLRDPLQADANKAAQRIEKTHGRIAEARIFLCYQAASLAGLQRRKNADGTVEYWLAHAPLYDLRHLGHLDEVITPSKDKSKSKSAVPHSYEACSASLEQVCRLLSICCHYLSVRMPAEIVVPRSESIRPMIFPEKSSYQPRDEQRINSNTSSPTASRLVTRGGAMPRPRFLYLDRSLQQLAKDDTKSFQFFLEGAMLLAWNVSWLCKMQGVDTVNSFEDVCAIGKNLYQLFISSNRPSASRRVSEKPPLLSRVTEDRLPLAIHQASMAFGVYSHNSARFAIHGPAGLDMLRNWRLASPTVLTRLVDKLAKHITSELADREWGILEAREWDEEREDEQAVLVGGARSTPGQRDMGLSVMDVAPAENESGANNASRAKGASGWMKIRDRGGTD